MSAEKCEYEIKRLWVEGCGLEKAGSLFYRRLQNKNSLCADGDENAKDGSLGGV